MEYIKYSYQKVASKLSSFVIHNQPVRIITCFAGSDPGRDRASLCLLKQFGVVPEEINISGKELNTLPGLNEDGFCGLTIIVNSVSTNEPFTLSKIPGKYQHLINHQTKKLSNYFQQYHQSSKEGYVYISGFSVLSPCSDTELLPETEFLPWYLEIEKISNLSRVVRQPELSHVMHQLTEVEPQIHCLDDFLDRMIEWENQ